MWVTPNPCGVKKIHPAAKDQPVGTFRVIPCDGHHRGRNANFVRFSVYGDAPHKEQFRKRKANSHARVFAILQGLDAGERGVSQSTFEDSKESSRGGTSCIEMGH